MKVGFAVPASAWGKKWGKRHPHIDFFEDLAQLLQENTNMTVQAITNKNCHEVDAESYDIIIESAHSFVWTRNMDWKNLVSWDFDPRWKMSGLRDEMYARPVTWNTVSMTQYPGTVLFVPAGVNRVRMLPEHRDRIDACIGSMHNYGRREKRLQKFLDDTKKAGISREFYLFGAKWEDSSLASISRDLYSSAPEIQQMFYDALYNLEVYPMMLHDLLVRGTLSWSDRLPFALERQQMLVTDNITLAEEFQSVVTFDEYIAAGDEGFPEWRTRVEMDTKRIDMLNYIPQAIKMTVELLEGNYHKRILSLNTNTFVPSKSIHKPDEPAKGPEGFDTYFN